MRETKIWRHGRGESGLCEVEWPLSPDRLLSGSGPWEVELGFGKGRFLLERASACRERRFLGIEIASPYYRLAAGRAERRGLTNLVLIRGESLYLLATALPRRFAEAVHVYFPDPWPKSRHQKRRLFDAESIDLILDSLVAGGVLYFASDHPDYGPAVRELLLSHPGLEVRSRADPWPGGARTNYEAKYIQEGRGIVRLEARPRAVPLHPVLHPAGRPAVLAATAPTTD